jgi:spermidine/putrescine transport system ATP-binding protein
MSGAVIVDSSFIGVSTQYVVRMPWGQEMLAFEQNTGARGVLPPGTKVDVSWRPEFAFLLDASQDADAGREED